MAKINFKEIPEEQGFTKLEAGLHDLEITRADIVFSKGGSEMLQLDYKVVGKNASINYDNAPIEDKEGNPIWFGQKKVKALANATGLRLDDEVDLSMIATLLKGKKISAEVIYKEGQKYPEIDGLKIYAPQSASLTSSAQDAVQSLDSADVTFDDEDSI